jgi:hypothetical protein
VSIVLKIKFITSPSQTNECGEFLINAISAEFKNILHVPIVPMQKISNNTKDTVHLYVLTLYGLQGTDTYELQLRGSLYKVH